MSENPNNFTIALEMLLNLYSLMFLMRALLYAVRADYYNAVCQIIIKATDPVIKPLKVIIPPVGPADLSSIFAFLGLIAITVVTWDSSSTGFFAVVMSTLARAISITLLLYTMLIFLGALFTWADQGIRHPIIPLIRQLNEPVLKPFRRLIPPIGGIDLSPLFAILAIQLIKRLIGL